MDNISELPQEGWPSGVGSHVQAHGPLFELWRVPCGGGGEFHISEEHTSELQSP